MDISIERITSFIIDNDPKSGSKTCIHIYTYIHTLHYPNKTVMKRTKNGAAYLILVVHSDFHSVVFFPFSTALFFFTLKEIEWEGCLNRENVEKL